MESLKGGKPGPTPRHVVGGGEAAAANADGARPGLFPWLCQELGYAPDQVISVRLNSEQIVVVEREPAGSLHIATYEPADGRLQLVARGPAVGRRPSP
jgi:hypothetical protein